VRQRDYLLVYIAGGLAAAGLGAVNRAHRSPPIARSQAAETSRAASPAHEVAMEKLDRLGGILAAGGDLRPFYYFELSEPFANTWAAVSASIRWEMTTEELVATMRRVPSKAPRVLGSESKAGCRPATWLKFAKVSPSAEQARGALETAILMVAATRPPQELQATHPCRGGARA